MGRNSDTPEAFQIDPMSPANSFNFSEKKIRRGFIKKVYGILAVQLAITCAFIAVFIFVEDVKTFAQENVGITIGCSVGTFVIIVALACCGEIRRKFPLNIILLLIFTVLEGFLLGSISALFDVKEVLIAVGICVFLCLGLTAFAFQSKIDFTMLTGLAFMLVLNLIFFGIFAAIFQTELMNILYSVLGALIFSFYLVIDTQLMIGGKHKYALSPEEYIFAALNLYIDIINIFLFILAIFGRD